MGNITYTFSRVCFECNFHCYQLHLVDFPTQTILVSVSPGSIEDIWTISTGCIANILRVFVNILNTFPGRIAKFLKCIHDVPEISET